MSGEKTESTAEKETETPAARLNDTQNLLIQLSEHLPASDNMTAAQRKLNLEVEQRSGNFGPHTQKALSDAVQWLEKEQIPGFLHNLKAVGAEPKEVIPGVANEIKDGRYNLDIKTDKIPQSQDVDKLYRAVEWLGESSQETQKRSETLARDLNDFIVANKLPQGWQKPANVSAAEWMPNAARLVNAAISAKTQVEISHELQKLSGGAIQSSAPEGTKIETSRWSGKLQAVKLDLPQSWQIASPEDQKKVEQLEQYAQREKARVAPHLENLKSNLTAPEKSISWGDWDIPNTRAQLDSKGNLVSLLGKDDKPQEGMTATPVNLLESRYSVSTNPQNGKIVIDQSVQAQAVPIYGYQNLIYTNVGQPSQTRREFAPDEWVTVRNGSEMQILKAKDLQWEATKAKLAHYGTKGGVIALDVALATTGVAEIAGAVRATRAVVAATDVGSMASKSTALLSPASRQIARGGVNLTVSGIGVLDNASKHENSVATPLLLGRQAFFLGQSAKLLASPLFKSASSASASEQALLGFKQDGAMLQVMRRMNKATQALSAAFIAESTRSYAARPALDSKGRGAAQRVLEFGSPY